MRYVFWGIFWIGVYLLLTLIPLLALVFWSVPEGRGFWWDLSIALGFAGASMMAVMFFLTARFKRAALPFGIDLVYYYHRQISIILLLFLIAHPVIIYSFHPGLLDDLHPASISWHMLSGIGAITAFAIIMITSLWRKKLHIHYDSWRIWHALLAAIALLLAILHIVGIGNYLATPVKSNIWTCITLSWIFLLFYVRLIKPFFIKQQPYMVHKIIRERGDTWSLEIIPAGHPGIRFAPGQFVWLTLGNSVFAMKEHPFSISSSAEQPEKLCFTIKELGDFTRRIKDAQVGESAFIDGPYGSFSIDRHPAPGYVFVAGGIGIAPIMGMLRTLADRQAKQPLILFYAYNNLERLTFYEELERLQDKLDLQIIYVLQAPPPEWQGETGFITENILIKNLPVHRNKLEYFVCGPVPLIQLIEKILHQQGVYLSKIHSELFDLV
jgi:predicted ferric reductase